MDESIFERLDRVTKERDAAVAEAKELKEALHDAWTDISQQNHKSRQQIRRIKYALEGADALIAAAKEGK